MVLTRCSTGSASRLPGAHSSLHFAARAGRTVLLAAYAQLPLVVQRPLRGPAGEAVVTMLTPAAALFDEDALSLEVTCGPHTDVTLTTAAATKLNRCERGQISFDLRVRVAHGATFRYLPHELIPFRDTRYTQRIALELRADARAWLLEVVTPGPTDSPFTYRQLVFETEVRHDDSLVALERFELGPRSRAQLRGYTHYGSLVVLGERQDASAINERLAIDPCFGLAAASALPANGIGLKMLGGAAQSVRDTLLGTADMPNWLRSVMPP
jgi:urease accessory protein